MSLIEEVQKEGMFTNDSIFSINKINRSIDAMTSAKEVSKAMQ